MRAGDTLGELSEERLLDFDELGRLDDVQNLLQLVQEHHLLRTVSLWPELQQTHDHLEGSKVSVLQKFSYSDHNCSSPSMTIQSLSFNVMKSGSD